MKLLRNSLLFLISFPLVFGCGQASSRNQRPNIVLIVIDTLRADHLTFQGYKKNTSPRLADLAKKSVVFENAYTTSTYTTPATASIFTSLFPLEHGLTINASYEKAFQQDEPEVLVSHIPKSLTTISEFLKNSGYQTYGISHNINIYQDSGFARGFDKFKHSSYGFSDHGAKDLNDEIQKWWLEDIDQSQPYFLYIHYMDPHSPYHQQKPWYQNAGDEVHNLIASYDSEINYVDRHIGFLSRLCAWQKNTLVIITADHGEEFYEHGSKEHGNNLYQEVLHVPLMLYYPKGFPSGKRIAANVSNMDIYPTVCEILGKRPDKKFRGKSLLNYVKKGTDSSNERFIYSHVIPFVKQRKPPPIRSIIYKEWKYIESVRGNKLYNLKDDPGEKTNLYAVHPVLRQSLRNQLVKFLKSCRTYKREYTRVPAEPQLLDEFKALGYLQ